jgi:hypothetical protein
LTKKNQYVLTWNSTSNTSFLGLTTLLPKDSKLWDEMYDKKMLSQINNDRVPERIHKKMIQDLSSSMEKLTKMLSSKLFSKKEIDKVYNELTN